MGIYALNVQKEERKRGMAGARQLYRTESYLRQVAIEKGLRVGSRIVVNQKEWSGKHYERTEKGKVIGIYPHIILFQMDSGCRECFRYNEILGYENVKVKVK